MLYQISANWCLDPQNSTFLKHTACRARIASNGKGYAYSYFNYLQRSCVPSLIENIPKAPRKPHRHMCRCAFWAGIDIQVPWEHEVSRNSDRFKQFSGERAKNKQMTRRKVGSFFGSRKQSLFQDATISRQSKCILPALAWQCPLHLALRSAAEQFESCWDRIPGIKFRARMPAR